MLEKETLSSKKYDSITYEKMQKLIQDFLNIMTIKSIKEFNKACKESKN
jgi:hypothetical protein